MRSLWMLAAATSIICLVTVGCGRNADTTTASPPEPPEAQTTQQSLHVSVACGVAGPFSEIKKQFLEEHPEVEVEAEAGNVVVMARQIEAGKLDTDVYMSIGDVAIGTLQEADLLLEEPTTFAENTLALVVAEGNPLGIETFEDIANEDVETIAVADDKSAPGHFGQMALKRAGLYEKVKDRLVLPEQPIMLKSYVAEGKADAAIMLSTCFGENGSSAEEAELAPENAEMVLEVPHEYYDVLPCQVAIMKDTSNPELARQFTSFLKESGPQQILSDWGFVAGETESEGASCPTL